MIAMVEHEVLRRLHADVVPLDLSIIQLAIRLDDEWSPRRLFDGTPALFPPGIRIAEDADGGWVLLNADGSPSTFRMPRNGHYFDDTSFNRGQRIDPDKFRPVSDIADDQLDILSAYAQRSRNTDYAILGWGFGVCFLGLSLITDRASNVTQGLPDQWMMMLLSEKETCHAMMDRSVEATIRCLALVHRRWATLLCLGHCRRRQRHAAGGVHQARPLGGDDQAALQKALRLDPRAYVLEDFLHSCGSVYNLMPHFIEAGIDILNPVQTSAANMDPARLKRNSAADGLLGRGVRHAKVLGQATPQEVRRARPGAAGDFSPDGGYVFNQVHNIQANVPAENIIAMFDAAYESGSYGGGTP